MYEIKKDFLRLLLRKGSLRISESTNELFVFKSGRRSPNFINIGALTDGEALIGIKKAYANFIYNLLKEGKLEKFDFIFGPAYKGINLACLACEGLYELGINVRYLYDRKEEKAYADTAEKVIVGSGYFRPGSKILLIDDVITTGLTKTDALEKLKILGDHRVVGLVLAVDRQEKMGDAINIENKSAAQSMEDAGIKTFSILTMQDIFNQIKNSISDEIRKSWTEYYEKYGMVRL